MTKEELEKEAEEKYGEVDREFMDCQDEGEIFNLGYLAGAEPREKRIAELEAEVKEWKDEWQEQVQKATDEGYARTLQTMQLTKAKELLKKLYEETRGYMNDEGFDMNVINEVYDFINSEVEK